MSIRVLCLGNDILGDDAFGPEVAAQLRRKRPDLDVAVSSTSGFGLLDETLGARILLVVDVLQSGMRPPGTLSLFRDHDVEAAPGGSPHFVGLFEALRLGRALRLAVPEKVMIIAVEPYDCMTVGADMHPLVRAAVTDAVRIVESQAGPNRGGAVSL
jgi:hydrogenase maturation protease